MWPFQLPDLGNKLIRFGFVLQDLLQALKDLAVTFTELPESRLQVHLQLLTQPCLEMLEGLL